MILPTIISLSETALQAISKDDYAASLALGASHERTVFKVMLPEARSGIFSAIILGVGRATEEGMLSVPDSVRQASFALGAGKIRTIFTIVLPEALPGILAGVLLAVGWIIGETVALMYTLGTSTNMPTSLLDSGWYLALHMYVLSSEGLYLKEAYATGVILIVTVLVIQTISTQLSKKLTKGT